MMPCKTNISQSEESNHFKTLLCKACKYLSVEQISSLTNFDSSLQSGLDWYLTHLLYEYCSRYSCHIDDVLDIDYEISEIEKNEILKELNRIGYAVKEFENGSIMLGKLIDE